MKPSNISIIKITIFVLIGILFGGSLVVYSNSRGSVSHDRPAYDEEYSGNEYDDATRRYEKVFTVKEGGLVKVDADAGSVDIDSWDKNEVSVVVEIEGSDSRVGKYVVDFDQDGNTVYIKGKIRDRSFFHWNFGNISAHYTIFTPKKFSCDVKTSGGTIDTKNITGKTDLVTSGGDVRVENVNGRVYASTSGGDVETSEITGDVVAETSGGSVRCDGVEGNFDGSTSGGDVRAENVNGKVQASTSGGSIKITLAGENHGVDAGTSGGNIDIYVKKDITADVDAETSGGSVDCELPIVVKGSVHETELHGKINGGGNLIHAGTSGGSIRIGVIKW